VIKEAAEQAQFVLVDLEGAANLMVSYAISMSDFVVIPLQGSHLDATQAGRAIKLIKDQERVSRRSIPFAVLLTRSRAAARARPGRQRGRRQYGRPLRRRRG